MTVVLTGLVSERLRKARLRKGYTQKQMVEFLGYKTQGAYSMIENGKRKMPLEKALAISKILEVPLDELFFTIEIDK